MSSGSDASHFGYGKIVPNSNINGQFVNKDSSTFSGSFSSNEIPHSCLSFHLTTLLFQAILSFSSHFSLCTETLYLPHPFIPSPSRVCDLTFKVS